MKTTVAFKAFANRNRAARMDRKNFAVVGMKKDGTPYKVTAEVLGGLNAVETREQAEDRLAKLIELNPGSRFAIVEL